MGKQKKGYCNHYRVISFYSHNLKCFIESRLMCKTVQPSLTFIANAFHTVPLIVAQGLLHGSVTLLDTVLSSIPPSAYTHPLSQGPLKNWQLYFLSHLCFDVHLTRWYNVKSWKNNSISPRKRQVRDYGGDVAEEKERRKHTHSHTLARLIRLIACGSDSSHCIISLMHWSCITLSHCVCLCVCVHICVWQFWNAWSLVDW